MHHLNRVRQQFGSKRSGLRPEALMSVDEYKGYRPELIKYRGQLRRWRRITLGRNCSLVFEHFDTLYIQIMEMLRLEGDGDEKRKEEVEVYAPLVPADNRELVATLLIECDGDDKQKRIEFLRSLEGIEHTISMRFNGNADLPSIDAELVDEEAYPSPRGIAAAVQFIRFPLDDAHERYFFGGERPTADADVRVHIEHRNYTHSAPMHLDCLQSLYDMK
jgi:Protein of unknown function (DUF3501)